MTKTMGLRAKLVISGFLAAGASISPSLTAIAGGNGSTAFDFLSIPVGPRQMAMGGSGVAVADDLYGANINPAALGRLWRQEVSLIHTRWMDDVSYQYLGYAYPTSGKGTFAGSLYQLSYGDIAGYDNNGAKTGTLRAQDRMAQFSYGKPVLERLWAGASVKYIQGKLHTKTANAAVGDVGILYRPDPVSWLPDGSLGLSIRNFGTRPKFVEESTNLPRLVQGGLAIHPFYKSLTLSTDFTKELASKLSTQVGAEYLAKNVAAFRIGYNSAYNLDNGLSFGIGVRAWDVQLDYAFAMFSTLGNAHHFGLTLRFGSLAEQHYERGMEAMRQNDHARAIIEFGRALSKDPQHRRALLRIKEANEALQSQIKQLKP